MLTPADELIWFFLVIKQ